MDLSDLAPTSINPKEKTLLIVDDEVDLREVLAVSFRRVGFNVIEAANGREAYEAVIRQRVDLVVSDIQMSGGSGVELLERLRQNHHQLPVVLFLTGFAEISVEDAYNKGAEALFSKPFDFKTVLRTVFSALETHEERWKRRLWRGVTAIPVDLNGSSFEVARAGKVMNLGRGGLFVASDGILPKLNELIDFKIKFTEGPILLIEGRGVVKWLRIGKQDDCPPGYGLEFIELSDLARAQVIELVNFLKTRQYIPKV